MAHHTIREVQQAFLSRKPLKTTHLESTEDGRLVSYGWYEIARWVSSCRLHGVKNDDPRDQNPSPASDLHFLMCPLTRTRIVRRNNGKVGNGVEARENGWYSVSTSRHASYIAYDPNVETSPVPTPRGDPEMRF